MDSLIAPVLIYAYEVSGETHYGSARCVEIREELEIEARDATEKLEFLRVRYDAADPMESRLLNEDNPGLRLNIDHESP
jgi:hypothetical protein